jgi:hypothetical protein
MRMAFVSGVRETVYHLPQASNMTKNGIAEFVDRTGGSG